jgi:hypothetical protein
LINPGKKRTSRVDFDCLYLRIPFSSFSKSHPADQIKQTNPEKMIQIIGDENKYISWTTFWLSPWQKRMEESEINTDH